MRCQIPCDFLNEQDFFFKRPDLKYALFDIFVDEMLRYVTEIYLKIPAYALDEILRREFGKEQLRHTYHKKNSFLFPQKITCP